MQVGQEAFNLESYINSGYKGDLGGEPVEEINQKCIFHCWPHFFNNILLIIE